jgi:hypothetical protein
VVSPARLHASHLEAAMATEFAARGELAEGARQASTAASVAAPSRISITRDERSLGSLVPRAGTAAIVLYAKARASISSWRWEEERFIGATRVAAGAAHQLHAARPSGVSAACNTMFDDGPRKYVATTRKNALGTAGV